jgi:hypothetical protein
MPVKDAPGASSASTTTINTHGPTTTTSIAVTTTTTASHGRGRNGSSRGANVGLGVVFVLVVGGLLVIRIWGQRRLVAEYISAVFHHWGSLAAAGVLGALAAVITYEGWNVRLPQWALFTPAALGVVVGQYMAWRDMRSGNGSGTTINNFYNAQTMNFQGTRAPTGASGPAMPGTGANRLWDSSNVCSHDATVSLVAVASPMITSRRRERWVDSELDRGLSDDDDVVRGSCTALR